MHWRVHVLRHAILFVLCCCLRICKPCCIHALPATQKKIGEKQTPRTCVPSIYCERVQERKAPRLRVTHSSAHLFPTPARAHGHCTLVFLHTNLNMSDTRHKLLSAFQTLDVCSCSTLYLISTVGNNFNRTNLCSPCTATCSSACYSAISVSACMLVKKQ